MTRVATFFTTSVGKKIIMAVTGIILFGFVAGHMAGNLQVFLPHGNEALDHYGVFLRTLLHGSAIWVVRSVLLLSAGLHVWAFLGLWLQNRAARPLGYKVAQYDESTWASRTMKLTGPLLLAFIVYHLLHLTVGSVHPHFVEGKIYDNLVSGLQVRPVALFYLVAMCALAFHLWHGFWSMLQTLGISHPKIDPWRKRLAVVFTILVAGGFAAVPLAILAGVVK